MTTVNQKIGILIQRTRQQRNITQADLAKLIGTSQSAINRIEHGKQNLSLETIARISDALDKQLMKVSDSVSLRIHGGKELHGAIEVNTSKNAAVHLLCASLLNSGTTRLKKVARIEEVFRIIEVLQSIGVDVKWHGADLEIKPPKKLDLTNLNADSARKTRSIIMFLGPLMHLSHQFEIPYAGGCKLGKRTIQAHSYALNELGLNIETANETYQITANPRKALRPIVMYESGDTATTNILLAAAKTPGKTIIKMASANYMVQDICLYLRELGVQIDGIGSTTLTVHGVSHINKSVTYSPSEDPVEAMTFIAAAVTTNSSILVRRAPIDFLELELLKLEKMGLKFDVSAAYSADNGYTQLVDVRIFKHNGSLQALADKIDSRPFPGLNIDHLPYFVPIAATAHGRTLIHDWVYENRAIYYTELTKLGADIELADPHRAFVTGPTKWRPTDMVCPVALRPAVINLIGMLAAPGVSVLRNIYTIARGYEDIAERFNSLGADIEVIHDL
ncbi:UDP-N-acetylglucosamine 1-carboxyvinyltransferase [Candidatus Saccharibacteria bacterium]|nr:UDP-N-acetylglucosamine 1-carboxyvinyltransferase [Candidatus Saccharibacteria bacterium]MCB9820949.1 UDP-N-acetylglucosamine 1-carboxyvinyltransferase [Candidatus Nomurabacteria bacterium]